MCLLAETGFPAIVVLVALAMTITLLLFRSGRYFARQEKDCLPIIHTPRPEGPNRESPVDAPDSVLRWEVRMHDLARDLSGQLDSKVRSLQQLVGEADRAAGRLEAALSAAQAHDAAPSQFPANQESNESAHMLKRRDPLLTSQVEKLASAGSAELGLDLKQAAPDDTPGGSSAKPRREEIYLLADYGFEPVEIAHRTKTPVGEVQLILSLRGKQ